MRRVFRAALALAVLPVFLLTVPRIPLVSAASAAVQITDGAFKPATLTISQGDVVTWTNDGTKQHTVTAGDGSFDSGPLSSGDVFGNLFDKAGTFTYHDALNPTMRGTVIVTATKATPTPNGTPAPTPPPGTLPPNFKTPSPAPTPTASSAESPGAVASPTGSAGGPGGGSGEPERQLLLLVLSVAAGIASLGLWIASRRQDTHTG